MAPENAPDGDDTSADYRALAEKLMTHLAHVRNAYETATWNHPDDDLRILMLGMSEAAILDARRILYDEPQVVEAHLPDNPRGVWCCDEHRQAYFDGRLWANADPE